MSPISTRIYCSIYLPGFILFSSSHLHAFAFPFGTVPLIALFRSKMPNGDSAGAKPRHSSIQKTQATKPASNPTSRCNLKKKVLLILDEESDSKVSVEKMKSPSTGEEQQRSPSPEIIEISDTETAEDMTDGYSDDNSAQSDYDNQSDDSLIPGEDELCYVAPNLKLSNFEKDMVDDLIATTDLTYPLYVFEAVPAKASSGLFFSKAYSDNIPKPVARIAMKLVGTNKYVHGKLKNSYSNGRACITSGWKTFCIRNKIPERAVHVLKMHWSKKKEGLLKVHVLALSK
ncbi:hypothetical protein ACP70R_032482 [Stipagrostis hirtigluma subsp. patula]